MSVHLIMDQQQDGVYETPRNAKQHLLASDVKKMLREYKLEWETPQVLANLSHIAEKMAIELLTEAMRYAGNAGNEVDPPLTPSKNDIELAIMLRNQEDVKLPNEDAMIDAAVAVNGNPLVLKEVYGIPLPKTHLGNCNYQLQDSNEMLEMDAPLEQTHNQPYYAYIMPYDNYISNHAESMSNFMYNGPMTLQDDRHNMVDLPHMSTPSSPDYDSSSSTYDDAIPPENCGFCYDD